MVCCPIPLSPSALVDGWSYLEAMYHLCEIVCRELNPDTAANATYFEILENCDRVESIRTKLQPQLLGRESCKTAVDRLQHYAIRLHTSFVVSVCCRPALRHGDTNRRLDAQQRTHLADRCKRNLTETVRMFLAMHQLSVIPTRSWAFTYHGLSSAVLLGLLSETKADPEVRQLQGDLISALSATAAKDNQASPPGTSTQHYIRKTDRDIELSGPLSRALTALRNIYDHGSVVGSAAVSIKQETGTGGAAMTTGGSSGSGTAWVPTSSGTGGGAGAATASSASSSVPQTPVGLNALSRAAAMDSYQSAAAGQLGKQTEGWSLPGIGYGSASPVVGGLQNGGGVGLQPYEK